MAFTFKHYGTFTGPNSFDGDYDYDALSREGFWWNDLPIDNTFKIRDLGVLFFNNPSDYLGFYLNGVSTSLVTMTRNTSNIPTFIAQIDDTIFNGNIFANGEVVVNGSVWANEVVFLNGVGDAASYMQTTRSIANSKKSFDILHPNKKGYRLRHVCVEGPESAIYIRGKLSDSNVIQLPEYWKGLIDPETISVQLTQIGHTQDLIVEKIEWGQKIIVKSGNGTTINCYYQVWADRLGEKLIPEYKGETPNDYPGNNSEFSVSGWDYDRR